jgi:4-aminobutyrate aminotransferase-like enzyme
MAKNGVKTSLATDCAVRYLPPLIISKSEVDFFLEAIDKSIKEMC